LFHLVEKALPLRRHVALFDFRQFAQKLFLPLGQVRRRLDHNLHDQIARVPAAAIADAQAMDSHGIVALNAGAKRVLDHPIERGHLELAAERRLAICHRYAAQEVLAFALENRVRLYSDDYVQVAALRAPVADFAFARVANLRSCIDAGRNVDFEVLDEFQPTAAPAVQAWVADCFAGAMATWARLLEGKKSLANHAYTEPIATSAPLRLCALLGPAPLALRAEFFAGNVDGLFGSARRFFER